MTAPANDAMSLWCPYHEHPREYKTLDLHSTMCGQCKAEKLRLERRLAANRLIAEAVGKFRRKMGVKR